MAAARRSASGTPRVRMPTSTTLAKAVVALDDLVGDATDGAADVLGSENDVGVHGFGPGEQ